MPEGFREDLLECHECDAIDSTRNAHSCVGRFFMLIVSWAGGSGPYCWAPKTTVLLRYATQWQFLNFPLSSSPFLLQVACSKFQVGFYRRSRHLSTGHRCRFAHALFNLLRKQ